MSRKMLIVSLDAVSAKDIEMLCRMPNFSSLLRRGTLVTDVQSVFLSNTYPAHASIVTGVHPCRHGVIENTLYQPELSAPDWRWYRSYIRVTTLFDEAKTAGLTTCSVLWPVTAGADITWNMPEIFGARRRMNQLAVSLQSGSKRFQLGALARFGRKLFPLGQPSLDHFATAVAARALRVQKPDLTLLHLTDVDTAKHRFGPYSAEAADALDRHDVRLGQLITALKDAATYDSTEIILLGDHGCLRVERTVDLNQYTAGFGGRAGFHQAGGCAFLHLSDLQDAELAQQAAELVQRLLADESSGVLRPLTRQEMAIGGFDSEYACGLEAKPGVSFGKPCKGQHGYSLAQPDYTTFYLAAGPDVPEDLKLTGGSIVDLCPLAATLLGLQPWDMDGKLRIPLLR